MSKFQLLNKVLFVYNNDFLVIKLFLGMHIFNIRILFSTLCISLYNLSFATNLKLNVLFSKHVEIQTNMFKAMNKLRSVVGVTGK